DALTCTGSPNDLAVLYDPIVDLNYSTVYTVEVTAHDVAGNVVGPVTWSFTTVKDVSGVAADQFVPDRNAIDVPIETNISLRLTDSQAGIDASKLQMWVQGAEVTDLLTVDQTPNPSTHPTTLVVTYNPPLDLPYGTDIPVRVYVKDAVGNETNLSYKFRTTDAPTYTVSGVITDAAGKALGGVTVTAGGLTATSDGTGGYRISGLLKGTYTVTPTRDQYDFVPASLSKALGPDDAVDVNFVGTLRTYKVSGRVTLGGSGIAGVLVSCNGQTRTTVANGTYPAFDLPNGQYTVTPTKANFHFQPTSRAAQVDSAPVTGVDFAAIADTFTISGTVKDNAGNRVKGVQVKAADKAGLQASLVAVTSDAGLYQLAGLKAGDFTLSATKAGYTITRDTYVVTVPPSAIDVDFTAMVEMTNTFPAGWNLIGLPGSPVDTDATKVFGTVQCYRYDPEATPPTYRAPINDPTLEVVRVKPGRGFFVRYTTAQTLSVGGLPTDSTKATSLGLSNGWNMIANPLATPVKWSRFVPSQPAGIRPYAFVFDTTTRSYKMVSNVASVNADRDSLMGWEGGWVRAVSGGVSLVLGSSASASADEVLRPQQADLNGGWAIAVQAKAGKLGDFSSVAGLVPGSGSAHVVENPPTAPEAVDVYFTNSAGQRLAHDVRSQSGPQTYDFVVACGVPAVNVTVSLPDLSKVPADQQIMLIDKDAGKTMYART
ncbi:MAG: carboxypeptidase-like regulatory domain-containing protein, partial [Armatimonadota bacterium]